MNRRYAIPIVVLYLAAGCSQFADMFTPGPAATPLTRVYQLRTDYTATMKVLVQARMLGKITDEQYTAIEGYRVQASAALNTLEAAASAGQPLDASLINQAQTAIDALIVAKSQVKG